MQNEQRAESIRNLRKQLDLLLVLLVCYCAQTAVKWPHLAEMSLRMGRNWTGKILEGIGIPNPYPASTDKDSKVIEKRTDQADVDELEVKRFLAQGELACVKDLRKRIKDVITELKAYAADIPQKGTQITFAGPAAHPYFFSDEWRGTYHAIQHLEESQMNLGWRLNDFEKGAREEFKSEMTKAPAEQPAAVSPNATQPVGQGEFSGDAASADATYVFGGFPHIAISFTLKEQPFGEILPALESIRSMYPQNVVLINGFMSSEEAVKRGFSPEVADNLLRLFPNQVNFFNPLAETPQVNRVAMAQFVRDLNATIFIVGVVNEGVAQEEALYKDIAPNCEVRYITVTTQDIDLSNTGANTTGPLNEAELSAAHGAAAAGTTEG